MPNVSLRRINKTDMRRINSIVRACNTHNFSQATKTISNMNINSTRKIVIRRPNVSAPNRPPIDFL